jgi:hypothetical protein
MQMTASVSNKRVTACMILLMAWYLWSYVKISCWLCNTVDGPENTHTMVPTMELSHANMKSVLHVSTCPPETVSRHSMKC